MRSLIVGLLFIAWTLLSIVEGLVYLVDAYASASPWMPAGFLFVAIGAFILAIPFFE